ncbi:MAG: ABC transporter ATP-binding protein [Candidatus Omnitrophica bacterium]|nr:ABC transporter ATP-binding protein [Candidatus Omnitrophota bacterium]
MNKIYELNSLIKTFKSGRSQVFALNGVSMAIEEGDFVSVVGPSGSGKSTLLHVIGGLEYPSQGEVLYKGKNIYSLRDKKLSLWRNKEIGFVFQFYHLIEELNVKENIALSCFFRKRKYTLKKIDELLKYLGIGDRIDFFPSQLSGGEKQKVAIARALANDPRVLLCDEPTGNLDVESQEKVIELLEKLNKDKGKTIIMVTHNLDLAGRAGRVIKISAGEIDTSDI